ncbi:hypothetical protein [Elizabethkingia anophelis]|uniref:hypothetical protein n=1 Tax=Elizabethkingia anophelis TaxID=1117645 RepID=UPI002011F919|nr:hypothetical protein [Elizabethkingia anophelis]MCL1692019.1 hypothetical protein [Elizabethkingia anophelis]
MKRFYVYIAGIIVFSLILTFWGIEQEKISRSAITTILLFVLNEVVIINDKLKK